MRTLNSMEVAAVAGGEYVQTTTLASMDAGGGGGFLETCGPDYVTPADPPAAQIVVTASPSIVSQLGNSISLAATDCGNAVAQPAIAAGLIITTTLNKNAGAVATLAVCTVGTFNGIMNRISAKLQ